LVHKGDSINSIESIEPFYTTFRPTKHTCNST